MMMTDDPGTEAQVGHRSDAVVNGPEDGDLDWRSIDWARAEDDVRRLRQRIFTASRDGDLRKVRSLQKLSKIAYIRASRSQAMCMKIATIKPAFKIMKSRIRNHRRYPCKPT